MVLEERNNHSWQTRHFYILALICQTIGVNSVHTLPNKAVTNGATGYIIGCIVIFIILGIPLHYMECIVSQFTTRDCIGVWKIRPFLSHIGYFQMLWQVLLIINNHILASLLLHYLLISFENPIPYYICGHWATNDCNILLYNYTVNEDCIKSKESPSYCNSLPSTFPEYQYWRNYILGKEKYLHIAWRCSLASALIATMLFLSCFQGKKSVRWFIATFTIYPMIGYFLILVVSMQQKGLVRMYEDALDANFNIFSRQMQFSDIINQVLLALNIGVGISFNLASSTSFRSPCYLNSVITVIACSVFSVLATCVTAMMACPYAYEYNIRPTLLSKYKLNLGFERKPRLLHEYENFTFWLLLTYSCDVALAQNTNFILLLNLIEVIATRNSKVAEYPGLTCFLITIFIFLFTVPMLGNVGAKYVPILRKYINLVTNFLAILECLVFVVWYGLNKFCEDVHFMLGVPLKAYMKVAWISAIFVLGYAFCTELYNRYIKKKTLIENISWMAFICYLGMIFFMMGAKLLMAAIKKKFRKEFQIDPTWGPNTDLLKRSRAMFSTQAMTKEYMYRQYHLQARIYERQRKSNVRSSPSKQ